MKHNKLEKQNHKLIINLNYFHIIYALINSKNIIHGMIYKILKGIMYIKNHYKVTKYL